MKHYRHRVLVHVVSPSSKASTCVSLKLDDDIRQFEVAFFLQMSENTGAKEDLALTNAIQVLVQFQRLNLQTRKFKKNNKRNNIQEVANSNSKT